MNSKPLYVDATLLRDVASCSTKAALRHILGYTTPQDRIELEAGKAVHEALSVFMQGQSVIESYDSFVKSYHPTRDQIDDDRFNIGNVSTIVRRWLETHEQGRIGPAVVPDKSLVEVGFVVPIETQRFDRPLFYIGRMDAIGVDARGDWWVIEHKTTRRISDYWRDRWKMDSQATGYSYAARHTLGHKVVGTLINAIELSKLPSDPKRRCKNHGVVYAECGEMHAEFAVIPTTRSDEAMSVWYKDVEHLAQRYDRLTQIIHSIEDIQHVRMQGLWNFSCPWCHFKDFCTVGRQASQARVMLKYDPWQPFDLINKKEAHG